MNEGQAPKWLEDILDQLNSPSDTILTDPANTKKVLENLNMAACRFDHADGEVRMGLYVPCSDPKTREGVGLAVIFLGDDARLYRRAKSVQGAHLEEAAQDLLSEYMGTFHRPGAAAALHVETDAANTTEAGLASQSQEPPKNSLAEEEHIAQPVKPARGMGM